MKILQISATHNMDGADFIYGLGDDGLVYVWDERKVEWSAVWQRRRSQRQPSDPNNTQPNPERT